MIALYFLVIVAIWFFLTRWLWRLYCKEENSTKKVVFGLVVAVFVVITLWYGGARKFYYDWEVERLCALDGGIKVYKTVILPAEMFNHWGSVDIPLKNEAKKEDRFFYDQDVSYLRLSDPKIRRSQYSVYKRADEKLLGISVNYSRMGGDILSSLQPSSYSCKVDGDISILKKTIFIHEDRRK